MISIITCSRTAALPAELSGNIADTIGTDYELITIDNSRNQYNIFTAYNEGVRQAKGDILCFAHDDILFHTQNWGKTIEAVDWETWGLIGFVGGQFLPKAPCYWYSAGYCYGQILQGWTEDGIYQSELRGEKVYGIKEVAAVDGLCFFIHKSAFDNIYFDDVTYNGFHGYDIDTCMQIATMGKRIGVTNDILIEHKSIGQNCVGFFTSIEKFYAKWVNSLPIIRGTTLTEEEIKRQTTLAEMCIDWHKAYTLSEKRMAALVNSKAYKIGKIITKPAYWIRHLLHVITSRKTK